jgi:putative SOS response-associated peptidase YedK
MGFAKLYGSDDNQVLVTRGTHDEDDRPEVRFHFKPPNMGVCSVAAMWDDDDDGRRKADETFLAMTEDRATTVANAHKAKVAEMLKGW